MRKVSGILADTSELRQLILDNPELPIAVLCNEDVCAGDYIWYYASDIRFGIGELLDCKQPVNEEQVFTDKDDFYEKLEEWLYEYMTDEESDYTTGVWKTAKPSEETFQKRLAEEKAKYESYWKKCIVIYADV